MLSLYILTSFIVAAVLWYGIGLRRQRGQASLRLISQQHGCQPLKCLPNKWFPPFGLDKLSGVIEAEKVKAYPLMMAREHDKHGDTYAQWGGNMYTIITRDPENIREILSRQFQNFEIGHARHGCVMPLLGSGIFSQDGPAWSASRKLLAPLVQRPTLPDLGLIERHFQQLLLRIQAIGQPHFDLKDLLFTLSLELTTEFLLGEGYHAEKTAEADVEGDSWTDPLVREFNIAYDWIARRERLKVFYWMVDGRAFRQACSSARKIVEKLVIDAASTLKSGSSMSQYIALAPLLEGDVNAAMVRDQVMNLLLAGRDTSGALLSWCFYVLGRDAALLKSLKDDIKLHLQDDDQRCPTKAELQSMQVLDNFVSEALRYFPPVPLNGRFCTTDTYLPRGGGQDGRSPILVPRGSLIAFSTFATQHSAALYGDDVDLFKISRWSDERLKEHRMVDWSFHPFIGGPRKCLGERFAITQAKYITCRMVQHFDQIIATNSTGEPLPKASVKWEDQVRYDVSLTMTPSDGVWVRTVPKL